MKFEEALKAMREGKKVKRSGGKFYYYMKNNVLYHENSDGVKESLDDNWCGFTIRAVLSDEWVIVDDEYYSILKSVKEISPKDLEKFKFEAGPCAIEENKADKINMGLKDTIEMMTSNDYKDRFKAEYYQLKIRLEKLYEMLVRYDAGTLGFTPDCSIALLKDQLSIMRDYLYALQVRAEIEGIKL